MTRQAQVGAFALLALLLLFGVFYVITDFGTRHTGYRIGVHFESAAGLHAGALVYFSGVGVGSVDSITLLPDNTVDVILAINRDIDIPRDSKFLIQAPLTGDPNLIIVPPVPKPKPSGIAGPTPAPPAVATLERRVLPVDEQPQGTNTATVADLLEQGQGEIRKLDAMMSDLAKREPQLLDTFQKTLNNANALTLSLRSMAGTLSSGLGQASNNIVALTGTLNDTAQLNAGRINDLLAQFDASAKALNVSMNSLEQLATNKDLKDSLIATTKNIADTTQNIADLTKDLRTVTGDPQTQAQIKNTIANLDATMQRANSLLGELGGTSNVYGVDEGATPLPLASGTPFPNMTPFPNASPFPPESPAPSVGATPYPTHKNAGLTPKQIQLKQRLGSIARNLVAIQIRMSYLNPETVCCPNPLLTADRGPQTDINAVLFPRSRNSAWIGVNDIGYNSSTNVAVLHSFSPDFRLGGGVLYSNLGLMAQFNSRVFGFESRFYNPRRPSLDLYGNINILRGLYLFAGERSINHPERRTAFGLQVQFP